MAGEDLDPNEITVAEARSIAETAESASNGIITERQMLAVLLDAKESMTQKEVGLIMDIEASTVASLKHTGINKLAGAKFLMKIIDDDPWWARIIEDEHEPDEKCDNCNGTGMVAATTHGYGETAKCPECDGKGIKFEEDDELI